MFGPILTGERIRLVPPGEEMIPLFCEWFADTTVNRYLNLRFPPSSKMEEEWYNRTARSDHDIVWAITVEGKPIGSTGIHSIDWLNRHATTGTIIGDRSEWGKGYGSETMRLRTRYAFENLNLEKLMTQVFEGNDASRRALEKAGYRQYGLAHKHMYLNGKWYDSWMGEILRDDWLAANSHAEGDK